MAVRDRGEDKSMGQKYVVWGTRAAGRELARQAAEVGCEVAAYCSGTKTSQGKRIDGIPVLSPEETRRLYVEKSIDGVLLGVQNPRFVKEVEETVSRLFPPEFSFISHDGIENAYLQSIHGRLQYRWDVSFERQAEIWLQNLMGEVDSWVRDAASPAGRSHLDYERRLANRDFLGIDGTVHFLLKTLAGGSVVMDMGCGLVSMYGTRLPNAQHVRLHAVDPLASFYNRINDKYAPGSGKICEFGLFEFAADFYPENYCDLILIKNALDHCIDPYKSIIECLYILKRGGVLHLRHRRAEALHQAYQGLHRWNIDYNERRDLMIWNQENAVNVSESLQEIAEIQVTAAGEDVSRRDQIFTAEIVKKRDFRLEEFLDMARERRQLAFLVRELLDRAAQDGEERYLSNLT